MNFVDKDVSEYELNLIYITINSSTIGAFYIIIFIALN